MVDSGVSAQTQLSVLLLSLIISRGLIHRRTNTDDSFHAPPYSTIPPSSLFTAQACRISKHFPARPFEHHVAPNALRSSCIRVVVSTSCIPEASTTPRICQASKALTHENFVRYVKFCRVCLVPSKWQSTRLTILKHKPCRKQHRLVDIVGISLV